ncbi:alkaline phosphatase [Pilimelia terevasa]|uniref:Alkaline phosphatase n=1 Tax=Pilimelia terevasa TaxID=53372 RepID=A0A8J3BKK1_9ACTN|nr:alkaline phosphatase D family protein [Pilimelia terevasa]GGK28164.1 alkaline phosphatase [Pilimelia terevasa]
MSAPSIVIGPLLRRVVGDQATVWLELSDPATVEVRAGAAAGRARTFSAYGHHYALVVVSGLPPAAATPYEVLVDGAPAWPDPERTAHPAAVIRTRGAGDPVHLVFGSCREATERTSGRGLPPDALDAYARRLAADPSTPRPDLLVLLGDQVYADETSTVVRRWLRQRRRPAHAPQDQVMTYEEYTGLYRESWRDPEIAWLLATVPSVMIFDDHEVIDDWNSSAFWREEIRRQPWWPERIAAGLASYWIYQHLGNLAPAQLAEDPLYARLHDAADATGAVREVTADGGRYRWSYVVDLDRTRLVMLDNRADRVLEPGRRSMLAERDWHWLAAQVADPPDHLVIGASLPWLLPPAVHHLENLSERLAESGRAGVRACGERLRLAVDLEHWGAFRASFDRLVALCAEIGSAARGPATISVLSGDVHHSYVARARYNSAVRAPVHQLTCSPLHNDVPGFMRPFLRLGWSRGAAVAGRALARLAGLPRPSLRWRRLAGPFFGNAVATLRLSGRAAHVDFEATTKEGTLRPLASVPLTGGPERG